MEPDKPLVSQPLHVAPFPTATSSGREPAPTVPALPNTAAAVPKRSVKAVSENQTAPEVTMLHDRVLQALQPDPVLAVPTTLEIDMRSLVNATVTCRVPVAAMADDFGGEKDEDDLDDDADDDDDFDEDDEDFDEDDEDDDELEEDDDDDDFEDDDNDDDFEDDDELGDDEDDDED